VELIDLFFHRRTSAQFDELVERCWGHPNRFPFLILAMNGQETFAQF
jgi:hypothetical protein